MNHGWNVWNMKLPDKAARKASQEEAMDLESMLPSPSHKAPKKVNIAHTTESNIRRGLTSLDQGYDQHHIITFCTTLNRDFGLSPHDALVHA